MKELLRFVLSVTVCLQAARAWAGDWPQFRNDAGRTAASLHELPAKLALCWTRVLAKPRPAFPGQLRLAYDACYEPVVLGKTMFVPSMVTDSVTALDTETGNQRWRFFAEGPVRLAPVAWEGKVYFVSDDGYLHCVNAADGTPCWKFRGLPEGKDDRKVIGHGRMVSLWPARGGPVLADGVIYFAAGLWPTEGVFVHAVDAKSGRAVWSNLECQHIPESNWDHGIGHYSGLTPQGHLAIVGDQLVVPCGTQLPAFLDLKTGKLKNYTLGWGGRGGLPKGCWFVAGVGKYLSHGGDLFDITRPSQERLSEGEPGKTGYKPFLYPGGWTRLTIERANQRELDRFSQPVMTPDAMYESDRSIIARDLRTYELRRRSKNAAPYFRKSQVPDFYGGLFRQLWELPSELDVHIKAGGRLYAGGPGVVEAIDTTGKKPKVAWRTEIKGAPHRMLAADGKLFIVTADGSILAFAAPRPGGVKINTESIAPASPADKWTEKTASILKATGVRDGYALVLGIDRGRLIEELVRQSKLDVIAVDSDPEKVSTIRNRLCSMGLYGTRASVAVGDPVDYPFSPYMASLIVSETPDVLDRAPERSLVRFLFHSLRPYGGVALATGPLADCEGIKEAVKSESLSGASVRAVRDVVLLTRSDPLPGAADWSHAAADAANTGASQDEFIRSPMAVLWFDATQRWHKFPGQNQVRVSGGRVVLLEENMMQASDVYTGRTLWRVGEPLGTKPLGDPNSLEALRYKRHRQWGPPPSLTSATQFIVARDAIYLSAGTQCLVFDPATGQRTGQIDLPEDLKTPWANLRVDGDRLVGTSGANVLCVHRQSGKLLWRVETTIRTLSVAVGGGKVFCSELIRPAKGEVSASKDGLFALDLATGITLWKTDGGKPLRYSPSHDIVVTPARFYRGRDGKPLPRDPNSPGELLFQSGGLPKSGVPAIIAGSKLITGNAKQLVVYGLPSGNPIGQLQEWNPRGCTSTRVSTHLVTTRCRGNSAWIDLNSRKITLLLGVRPGCGLNNNLFPANGVLVAPNLTAGCTCNYLPVSVACVRADVVRRDGGK